jgi:type IV secretion system protein VirB11
LIANSVHALVFMARDNTGQRRVRELVQVNGFDGERYDTTTLYEDQQEAT